MRTAVNTFRKRLALAAIAALLIASQPAESRVRGAQRQNVPFTISSFGSAFGVQSYAFAHSRRDLFADFVTEPGR